MEQIENENIVIENDVNDNGDENQLMNEENDENYSPNGQNSEILLPNDWNSISTPIFLRRRTKCNYYEDKKVDKIDHINNIYSNVGVRIIMEYIEKLSNSKNIFEIKNIIFNFEIVPCFKTILWQYVFVNSIDDKNLEHFIFILNHDFIEINESLVSYIYENGTLEMIEFLIEQMNLLKKLQLFSKFIHSLNELKREDDSFSTIFGLFNKYGRFIKLLVRQEKSLDDIENTLNQWFFNSSISSKNEKKTIKCSTSYQLLSDSLYDNEKIYNILSWKDYDTMEEFIYNINLSLPERYYLHSIFSSIVKFLCKCEDSEDESKLYRNLENILFNDKIICIAIFDKFYHLLLEIPEYNFIILKFHITHSSKKKKGEFILSEMDKYIKLFAQEKIKVHFYQIHIIISFKI